MTSLAGHFSLLSSLLDFVNNNMLIELFSLSIIYSRHTVHQVFCREYPPKHAFDKTFMYIKVNEKISTPSYLFMHIITLCFISLLEQQSSDNTHNGRT